MAEYKECPYCAEQILSKAVKCKHCKSMLEEPTQETPSPSEPQQPPEKEPERDFPPPPPPEQAPEPGQVPPAERDSSSGQAAPPPPEDNTGAYTSGSAPTPPPPPPTPESHTQGATPGDSAPPPPPSGTAAGHSPPPPPPPGGASSGSNAPPASTAGMPAVDSPYAKAPIGKRILAYIIDGLIGGVPAAILIPVGITPFIAQMQMASFNGGMAGINVGSIILFLLAMVVGIGWGLLYFLIRDGLGEGQSIGKKASGLMVVSLNDNRPCTKGNSAKRNVFAIIISILLGWIPVLNIFAAWAEPIIALIHGQGLRVGDMVAKTQVIDIDEYRPN